jgi:predicted DNA-binding antitoxin AbrB/MazE fold protein
VAAGARCFVSPHAAVIIGLMASPVIQTIDAVFEKGLLRPLEDLPLIDGQRVRVTVESKNAEAGRVLELAAKVYEGLTSDEIDEIEKVIQRRPFFNRSVE